MRAWPLRIDAAIADGQTEMDKKNEDFSANLEVEKEKFKTDLESYRELFAKIKTFDSIQKVKEFSGHANTLHKSLQTGFIKVEDFNRREKLFKMRESEWPELKELADVFRPFYEMINTIHDVRNHLSEWQGRLMELEIRSDEMEQIVQENI